MHSQSPHELLDKSQMEDLRIAAISSSRSAEMLDRMASLTDHEYASLQDSSIEERAEWLESKGKNRNKPCNCGSGKKFKKCCLE